MPTTHCNQAAYAAAPPPTALPRRALCALLIGCLATLAVKAGAETYPNKPVRVIIPSTPGGTLDIVGRTLAQKLTEQTGQSFYVENRAGANTVIGGDFVAKASADGYTLLFSPSSFTTAPMTMKAAPYSVEKDFLPIALVAKAPLAISVSKRVPANDLPALFRLARAQPQGLTFAVGSVASAGHLATELLANEARTKFVIVPYKGSAPAYTDLVGGQIDGFIDPILGSKAYYKSGMLNVIAVTSAKRLPGLENVPTVSETVPGFEFYSWYGLWGPAKLPRYIAEKLNHEVNKALAAGMQEKLAEQGLIATPGSSAQFSHFQAEDMQRSRKIVIDSNIKVE